MLKYSLSFSSFLSGCNVPTDCPHGGSNYLCTAEMCECPNPYVLNGDDCVGMLWFDKENSH